MACTKEYLAYILEQLSETDGISHKAMMGEYILYHRGKIAAYLCDNRLLVKPVPSALRLMPDARFEPPYKGAKDMLLCENTDDRAFLKQLFEAMSPELPEPKQKGKRPPH